MLYIARALLNARVADAVDCAVGLLADAAILLEARDKVITTGKNEVLDFGELSGVADSPDKATDDFFATESCEEPLINSSIFAMSMGYNRGRHYGGSISGLWAIMKSAFIFGYSIGTDTSAMSDRLSFVFAEVTASAEASASAGPHIDEIRIVKGCNYGCLRQKTIIEDNDPVDSSPCMVVGNDLDRFAATSWPTPSSATSTTTLVVVSRWPPLPVLTVSATTGFILVLMWCAVKTLAELYARMIGSMMWYRNNDAYNPAALCLLNTHWWQLANCRHRPVTLLGRTDHGVAAAIAPIILEGRPELEHFRASGTRVEHSEDPFSSAENRLKDLLASKYLPETRSVVGAPGQPGYRLLRGGDSLPSKSKYVGNVLTAQLAYPQG
ncbi:hypothetical protein N7532_006912 [Penicillium argentinense]|uniref:Uncharacterized protein n=1 Tax=Penicillium argentinense TaxID=1131581 RepID=A0A9W9FGT9_9EURO|nr:uncharacterized protein N7532_006912 [Penicillium argentinense]KAJ5099911.1 hypothetical protein N7532_006912 [Penicillium argentinense]